MGAHRQIIWSSYEVFCGLCSCSCCRGVCPVRTPSSSTLWFTIWWRLWWTRWSRRWTWPSDPSFTSEGWWTRKWWYQQLAPSSLGWWTRWEGEGKREALTPYCWLCLAVGSVKRSTLLVVLSQPLLTLTETFCVGMIYGLPAMVEMSRAGRVVLVQLLQVPWDGHNLY